jgi:TrmH family RNA methyltransferase
MGSIFWIPVLHSNFESFQAWAKKNAYTIYGSSAKSDRDYLAVRPYCMPRILLLGSERQGLTEEQKQACDIVVRVPMRGRASSLNLAVAAGILLYAMLDEFSEDTDRKNPPPI